MVVLNQPWLVKHLRQDCSLVLAPGGLLVGMVSHISENGRVFKSMEYDLTPDLKS